LYEITGTNVVYDIGFYFGLADTPVILMTTRRRPRSLHPGKGLIEA